MASNYTGNYNLCQWEATDAVLRTDFNEDNAKVDAALGTLAKQTEGKAEQTVVDSLSQSVAQKADQSALSAEISARTAGDAALQKKAGLQLIHRVTLSKSEEHARLTLSDIDWSQWATVRIIFKPKLESGDSYQVTLYTDTTLGLVFQMTGHFQLLFYPTFDADMSVCGVHWPVYQGGQTISVESVFRTMNYIEFSASQNTLLQGTVMEAWGSK